MRRFTLLARCGQLGRYPGGSVAGVKDWGRESMTPEMLSDVLTLLLALEVAPEWKDGEPENTYIVETTMNWLLLVSRLMDVCV